MAFSDRSPEHVNKEISKIAPPAEEADPPAVAENFAGDLTYIRNDALVANPSAILGSVFYERKSDSKLRQYLIGLDVAPDEKSLLTSPLVRQEILVNKSVAANISVLSMLTAEGTKDDIFEFRVVDNSVARVSTSNSDFKSALASWVSQPQVQEFLVDPDVGRIKIVAGVVQKYVSKKKFQKYTGKAEGNGWGVNLGGQLFLSSSNYSLDVVYGLDLLAYREVSTVPDAEVALSEKAEKITAPEFRDLRSMVTTDLSEKGMFMQAFESR